MEWLRSQSSVSGQLCDVHHLQLVSITLLYLLLRDTIMLLIWGKSNLQEKGAAQRASVGKTLLGEAGTQHWMDFVLFQVS